MLVVSADLDASRSLCAALGRAGRLVKAVHTVEEAQDFFRQNTPPVIVADTNVEGYQRVLDEVRNTAPWVRVHVLMEAGMPPPNARFPVIAKPFDASEIAERLGREMELAELERGRQNAAARAANLAMLVEECFEAIVGLDEEGRVRSWNPGAVSLYGYGAQEAMGRQIGFLQLEPGSTLPVPQPGERQMLEVRRRRKDGGEVLVLLSSTRVRSRERREFSAVEVSLDITERRKLERELEHSERLAAIGRIAAGMAHEINNPLSVIQSSAFYFAEAAQRVADPELQESAKDMELAIDRIRSFVQHVCGFARRGRPQLTDTPIETAIEVAVRMARPRAFDAGVTLEIDDRSSESVPNDSPRLAQAVLNILANAIDAARGGGKHVWLGVVSDGDHLCIRVEDDGPGLAHELEGRAFEPFATTKPYGQGTGLGLAITRQIMQDHGGTARLVPRAGGGARAELRIPKLATSAHQVLVLDPDPAVRRAVAQDLKRGGFSVVTSDGLASADEANVDLRPSLIISETQLSDADASDLVERIRARFSDARLLVLTGDPARHTFAGAARVMSKPWNREDLIAAARSLCI